MPTATQCILGGRTVSIQDAIRLKQLAYKDKKSQPPFACVECGQAVRPHKGGGHSPAHFEHLHRNRNCALSYKMKRKNAGLLAPEGVIDTAELARLTAGGDDYIRTKDGEVKGIALRLDLNRDAPEIIVVGKGGQIERRAKLLRDAPKPVPLYVKRGVNAWAYLGLYRATAYRTDVRTIKRHCGERLPNEVAGILFLESAENVTVAVRGGGFADPETRREVELAAINHVSRELSLQGFKVKDLQRENCGYDLHAIRGSEELLFEVKGTDGEVPRFFISRNERKCSMQRANWRLAIVTAARTNPTLMVLTSAEMENRFNFDCLAWECTETVERAIDG